MQRNRVLDRPSFGSRWCCPSILLLPTRLYIMTPSEQSSVDNRQSSASVVPLQIVGILNMPGTLGCQRCIEAGRLVRLNLLDDLMVQTSMRQLTIALGSLIPDLVMYCPSFSCWSLGSSNTSYDPASVGYVHHVRVRTGNKNL